MTSKTAVKSRILTAVHETASDLHKAGFIDLRRMREYDALCLAPVPEYSSKKIRALRKRHKLSRRSSRRYSIPVCRPYVNGRLARNIQAVHRSSYSTYWTAKA